MEKTFKRKSVVWEFFKWTDVGKSREVYCELCNYKTHVCPIQRSTSTMLNHVRTKHHQELKCIKDLINNVDASKAFEIEPENFFFHSDVENQFHESAIDVKPRLPLDTDGTERDEFYLSDEFSECNIFPDKFQSNISKRKPFKKTKMRPVVVIHDFEGFNTESDLVKKKEALEMVVKGDERKSDIGGFPGPSDGSVGSAGDNQGTSDDISIPLSPEQYMSEETEPVIGGAGTSCTGPSPHSNSQRPESYKLRHNNHLTLVLESLAGDESFMDVTLTAQGKAIKAHKSVLSAVSPYFRSVLKANPCQHPIIIMPRDIRFEELNNIISYIYKGEMTVAASDLSSLLKTAEVLQVTGLSPSETNNGCGIMSQMQGFPATTRVPNVTNNASHSYHKKQSQKQNQQTVQQQQHQQQQQQQPQQQQQQQQQHMEQSNDDDDDDEAVNEDTNDSQGQVDPLEFLNANMTCVKEEIRSDDEAVEEDGGQNIPTSISNTSPTHYEKESECVSSNLQNQLSVGSPKPIEDIANKPFNPGESDGCSSENLFANQTGSTSFLCPYCFEVHRPIEMLQSHLRLKHPSKPSFICACGKVYGRSSTFEEHSKKCKF